MLSHCYLSTRSATTPAPVPLHHCLPGDCVRHHTGTLSTLSLSLYYFLTRISRVPVVHLIKWSFNPTIAINMKISVSPTYRPHFFIMKTFLCMLKEINLEIR